MDELNCPKNRKYYKFTLISVTAIHASPRQGCDWILMIVDDIVEAMARLLTVRYKALGYSPLFS